MLAAAAAESRPQRRGDDRPEVLARRLAALSRKLDALYEDKVSGLLAPEDFAKLYAATRAERAELERRLATLAPQADRAGAAAYMEAAACFLAGAERCRLLLFAMIERVELGEDKSVTVYVRYRRGPRPPSCQ